MSIQTQQLKKLLTSREADPLTVGELRHLIVLTDVLDGVLDGVCRVEDLRLIRETARFSTPREKQIELLKSHVKQLVKKVSGQAGATGCKC